MEEWNQWSAWGVNNSVRDIAEKQAPTCSSFEEFFVDAWPWAFRLATLLMQDRAVGEEIAQDMLAAVYRRWDTLDRPEAYLRTSLVNACRNRYRHNGTVRSKLPLLAAAESVDFVADELADEIAALPVRQRTVIVLRYYCDLSEAEIAEALGCRPGTVKSLASRALNQLKGRIPR